MDNMNTSALALALIGLTSSGGGGGSSNVSVLSDTLTAGETSITFSDASITTDSFIGVASEAWYTASIQTTGSVTITFPEQSSNMNVQILVVN